VDGRRKISWGYQHSRSSQEKRRIMDTSKTTIAFVTDDGSTISSHFGRALFYEIVTLEGGKATDRRRVSKAGHHSFGPEAHAEGAHEHKHAVMTAPLTGVAVLVARGMGMGAQQHLLGMGIEPILTELHTIDEAIEHYLAATLVHDARRVHNHGAHHH
jgi:predicted Fe-Mo cluster-binding NifX family protein